MLRLPSLSAPSAPSASFLCSACCLFAVLCVFSLLCPSPSACVPCASFGARLNRSVGRSAGQISMARLALLPLEQCLRFNGRCVVMSAQDVMGVRKRDRGPEVQRDTDREGSLGRGPEEDEEGVDRGRVPCMPKPDSRSKGTRGGDCCRRISVCRWLLLCSAPGLRHGMA